MMRAQEWLIMAIAAVCLIAATLGTVLLYGDVGGRAIMAVGSRLARAGGGHGLVSIEEVEAIATVTCAEQAAASSERAIVVRRGK